MPIINLPVIEDGFVWANAPTLNEDSKDYMQIGYNTSGSDNYGLIKFNTGLIPLGKYIVSAKLYLTSISAFPLDRSLLAEDLIGDWDKSTVTYNNKPAVGSVSKIYGIPSQPGVTEFDIIDFLSKDYNDGTDYGLQINTTSQSADIYSYLVRRHNTAVPGDRPYVIVEYSNTIPVPPSLIYPDSVTVDRSEDLTFQWSGNQHLSSELVWNDGSDHTVVVPGNTFEYTLPGGTMLAGNITWKVKIEYNEVGFSEFSTESLFVSADKPATPVITTTALVTNLPTIDWTSVNQIGFNIKISSPTELVVDFTKYVSDLSYTLTNELLDDTEYTIELKIQDTTGLWSDFDVEVITSNFPKPDTPSFILTNLVNHAQVAITNGLNTEYNEIMKLINGEYVAIKTTLENETVNIYELISDFEETLKVRAYRSGGGFADSPSQTITITVKDSHLITYDESTELALSKTPKKNNGFKQDNFKAEFIGRVLPVAIIGEVRQNKPTWSFETFDFEEIDTLKSMVGVKTLFRDRRGFIGWYVIVEIATADLLNSTTLSIRNVIEVNR